MNRIRELRKQKDMTQKELAKHLQVADSTLSYWEMGRYEPDNEALFTLSRFFQVPIDYLLGGDFTEWSTDGNREASPYAETSHAIDSDASVEESRVVYKAWSKYAAFSRVEFEGLTQDEVERLAEFAAFIKSRRKKDQ